MKENTKEKLNNTTDESSEWKVKNSLSMSGLHEKLGAVGVFTTIGHGQDERFFMFHWKIFIWKKNEYGNPWY